ERPPRPAPRVPRGRGLEGAAHGPAAARRHGAARVGGRVGPAPVKTARSVYGLLERKAPPRLDRAPPGPPGVGPLRALPVADGLWCRPAPAPLSRYGSEPIERGLQDLDWVSACALGHERVAEHFLGQGTVLPIKLFTLFPSDAAALAPPARDPRRPQALRRRLRGREEWGVRLRRRAEAAPKRPTRAPRSGREFLERKQQARADARGTRKGDAALARTLLGELRRHAAAVRLKDVPSEAGRRLLAAVLLVDRTEAAALRRTVARRARALAGQGLDLALTGPWPAYHLLGSRE